MGENIAMAKLNTKTVTLRFMATRAEAAAIRHGAAVSRQTVSAFIRESAVRMAELTSPSGAKPGEKAGRP
jgi:uncharacterized protein (DUF1778 family)